MLKKMFAVFAGFTFLCVLGGVIYADACGVFLQDNEAAMRLVDRYFSSVMKYYNKGDEKISFRGIVKEGCDFWYYNDYNNRQISENHCSGSALEVEDTEYSVEYDKINYNNRFYTINATVTQSVSYKNYPGEVKRVSHHTLKIEQNGNDMYIVDDITDAKGDSLLPDDILQSDQRETSDAPK